MDAFFILAQITGVIGWIILVISYYKEDIDKLIFLQIISSIFYCFNYLFLGAMSGLLICLFELIKSIGYYKTDKDNLIFILSLPIYAIIAFFTYDSFIALLPVIGSVIDALTLTKSHKVAVTGGVISNIIWVIYDVLILSYSCALTDAILVISNMSILLLGYSRLIKSNKIRFMNSAYITRFAFNRIYKLDLENYGKKYLWETEYQNNIYNKNKDSFTIITLDNNIIGYINYLCIKEEIFEKLKRARKMVNEYKDEDIVKFYKSKNNYLVIESISLEKKYQNYRVSKKIKSNLTKYIRNKHKNGIKINGIICFAVSEFECMVLEEAKFKCIKKLDTGETLYELDHDLIKEHYLTKNYIKSEEKNRYKIVTGEKISDEDVYNIYKLDKTFYRKKYLWEYDYYLKVTKKTKDTLLVLKYDGKLIGYLRYLIISEKLYNEIKKSDDLINEYQLNDIIKLSKKRKNYLLIKSILIDESKRDAYAVKLLTSTLNKNIKKYMLNNYKIDGICGASISKDSKKLFEQFGLNHYKDLIGTNSVYILEGKDIKRTFY